MSVGPNEIDFVVRVQHEERLRQLTAEIAKEEKAIVELEAAMKKAGATQEQVLDVAANTYGASLRKLNKELADLKATMASVEAQAKGGILGGGGGGGGGRFNNPALGFLAISQAVEDAQYGFNAIVNNIPMIVMGLGGSAGIAGAASLAAVAINVLMHHVGDLRDALGGAWLGVPAEELAKVRQNAEEAAEAFDKLVKLRPKSEEERQKALIGAMQEADSEEVTKATREAIMRDNGLRPKLGPGDAADIAARAMLKSANPFGTKTMQENIEEAKADILKERAVAETKRILGNLDKHGPEGDRARQDMARLQKANPNTPLPNLEGIEQQQVMDKWLKMEQLQSEIGMKNAREREKENKVIDQLNRQGEENERAMKADRRRQDQRDLQDRQEALQKQKQLLERGMTAEQIKQAEDRFFGVRKPEQSQVMGMKQFADRMLTQGLSAGDQKKIDQLVQANKNLEAIKQEMRKINRLQ